MKGQVKYPNYNTMGKYKAKGIKNKRSTVQRKMVEAARELVRSRNQKKWDKEA